MTRSCIPPTSGPRRRRAADGEPVGVFLFLVKLYADGGYQGPEFQGAMKRFLVRLDLEIVKRLGHAKGFVVLPKRWIVERTLAWLGRCRRLAKDWECLTARRSPSCASPPSASCCESYAIRHDVSGQTFRLGSRSMKNARPAALLAFLQPRSQPDRAVVRQTQSPAAQSRGANLRRPDPRHRKWASSLLKHGIRRPLLIRLQSQGLGFVWQGCWRRAADSWGDGNRDQDPGRTFRLSACDRRHATLLLRPR